MWSYKCDSAAVGCLHQLRRFPVLDVFCYGVTPLYKPTGCGVWPKASTGNTHYAEI